MQINCSYYQSAVRSPQSAKSSLYYKIKRNFFAQVYKPTFTLTAFLLVIFLISGFVGFSKTTPIIPDANFEQGWRVTGKISGAGDPLIGVNIIEKGTTNGTTSDFDGNFSITVTDKNAVLVISYVGFVTKEININGKSTFDVILEEDSSKLDEVVVVSFGTQKKNSIVSSITTVKPSELKIPSSNLTTALAGRVAGLISYQRGGEPGRDNAEFFIRGITSFGNGSSNPLILIDGIELTVSDLRRLNPDDIAQFSILKDAPATALYGARGANGVILVTTKEGVEGPPKVSVRIESSFSSPTRDIEFADPITYMKLENEAIRTRDPLGILRYSQEKIENTIAGINPILYPTTDWHKELFKDYSNNNRANMSISGGGSVVRYYVSLAASQDNGTLKVPKISNFNNNVKFEQYNLRSNVNAILTGSTDLKLSFNASYDDYTGPPRGGSSVYRQAVRSNPVLFRPFYEKNEETKHSKHILFGNYREENLLNPYANLVRGYQEGIKYKIISRLELLQDLDLITEGLDFKFVINSTNSSGYRADRSYVPFFYSPRINPETKKITLTNLNPETGREFLSYRERRDEVVSTTYLEARLVYDSGELIKNNSIGGLLVFTTNNRKATAGSLEQSLSHRNIGISGRFTYGFKETYFAELNFGYNGSERFAKQERFGFFPSVGASWIVSNQKFFEKAKGIINKLKFRASYGLIGNDRIGRSSDRFFYLSRVDLNSDDKRYITGEDFDRSHRGVTISRYANDKITWETGEKTNLGIEVGLFNIFNLEVDFFRENRSNILFDRIIPSTVGLQASLKSNSGEARSQGIDGSISYNNSFNNGMWLEIKGNYTFARSEVTKVEEPNYSATPWLSRIGQPINQRWGFVAERLFVDENEVQNSPRQIGEYSGGDIKYRDINGDGKITNLDLVPIGNPTRPEIVYGIGFSAGYKGFDISCFLQGAANSSFWINPYNVTPFSGETQLLKAWSDDYWSETNRNVYAKWPRLSTYVVRNNSERSTWFMQDGSFLRMKSAEIGYSLSDAIVDKLKINKARFYVSGTNLFVISKFKLWDPELSGNGLEYPNQRVFNIGINISL